MNTFRIPALLAAVALISACGVDQAVVSNADGQDGLEAALTANSRFETFVGKDGQTYFHLLAGNGQRVLASEGYQTAQGAAAGIASVKANGVNADRYLLRESSDGAWYFVLVAGNGQIIAVSEMYASKSNATRAVARVAAVVQAVVKQTEAAQVAAHFEVFKGLDGKYYFHVKAGNGEIVLQSQAYTSKGAANTGAASVQTNGGTAARYTVLAAADGKFYFVLKAANGQVIGRGETYASKSNAERGVGDCVALFTAGVLR